MTGADALIDLTSDCKECGGDSELLGPVTSKSAIPWISKLPKLDIAEKKKVGRQLSAQDNINISELLKDAAWFEKAEQLFQDAMPPLP